MFVKVTFNVILYKNLYLHLILEQIFLTSHFIAFLNITEQNQEQDTKYVPARNEITNKIQENLHANTTRMKGKRTSFQVGNIEVLMFVSSISLPFSIKTASHSW